MESSRTSPAAKTPGTLVSSASGGRGSGQRPARRRSASGPVTRKPLSSRSTVVAQPVGARRGPDEDEEPVGGARPPPCPARRRRARAPRGGPTPLAPTTRVPSRTSMLSVARIRETRYWDIVASSDCPRTTSTTSRRVARQVEGRLPGGVGGADDVHVLPGALGGLARGGAVVDAAGPQGVQALGLEAAVGHAGRHEHGPGLHLCSARQLHGAHRATLLEADHVPGEHHLGPEPRRLGHRAVREVGPGQTLGEPEVVLDGGALAGLATRVSPARRPPSGAPRRRRRPPRRARPGRRPRCTGRRAAARPGSAGRAPRRAAARTATAAPRRRGAAPAGGRVVRSGRQPARPGGAPPRPAPRRASGRARGCGRGRPWSPRCGPTTGGPRRAPRTCGPGAGSRQSPRRSSMTG